MMMKKKEKVQDSDDYTEMPAQPPSSHSDDRFSPEIVRQALDRALDNLGPKMKPVIWRLLEEERGNSSFEERAPTLLDLELALRDVLGDASYIILDWVLDELEKNGRRGSNGDSESK